MARVPAIADMGSRATVIKTLPMIKAIAYLRCYWTRGAGATAATASPTGGATTATLALRGTPGTGLLGGCPTPTASPMRERFSLDGLVSGKLHFDVYDLKIIL